MSPQKYGKRRRAAGVAPGPVGPGRSEHNPKAGAFVPGNFL